MYHLERVKSRAEAYVAANDYSSIEWRIERSGDVLTEGRVGLADANKGTKLPEKPIYRIFSMTKPLISALGVMLVDEGRLRLSDPVAMHLPAFATMDILEADGTRRPAQNAMLVEHLFTHRSGITYQWQQDNPVAPVYLERLKFANHFSLAEMIDSLAELPLFAEPGTRWHYSYSTDVLAHLIAVIERKPIAQILRERILDPLGMIDTGYCVPESECGRVLAVFGDENLVPGVAKPVTSGDKSLHYGAERMIYPADNPNFERGGLGLFSTVADYSRAARFLLTGCGPDGGRMISKAGVSALWTNRLPEQQMPIGIGALAKYKGYGYGLGGRVLVRPSESPFYSVAGESGWEGAATTYFWLDPVNDITGVVMTQYIGQKFPLGEDIRHAFYQSLD